MFLMVVEPQTVDKQCLDKKPEKNLYGKKDRSAVDWFYPVANCTTTGVMWLG